MVKLNKIYTRTGDDGSTGLADGSRVDKDSLRVKAYGDVDEANSTLGVARLYIDHVGLNRMLERIQNDLFDLGADLATPEMEDDSMSLRIVQSQIDRLETELDGLNADLSALDSFVLPGGSKPAAYLHLARAITRRAEREVVSAAKSEQINPLAVKYINRLSDFLFVAARWCNDQGKSDVKWVPGANRE